MRQDHDEIAKQAFKPELADLLPKRHAFDLPNELYWLSGITVMMTQIEHKTKNQEPQQRDFGSIILLSGVSVCLPETANKEQ